MSNNKTAAARIASWMANTFYPQQEFVPLDTLSGILSQIDNMAVSIYERRVETSRDEQETTQGLTKQEECYLVKAIINGNCKGETRHREATCNEFLCLPELRPEHHELVSITLTRSAVDGLLTATYAAALAESRAVALEEAAQIAESYDLASEPQFYDNPSHTGADVAKDSIAAAIRRRITTPSCPADSSASQATHSAAGDVLARGCFCECVFRQPVEGTAEPPLRSDLAATAQSLGISEEALGGFYRRARQVTAKWYSDGRATARPYTRSQLEDLIVEDLLADSRTSLRKLIEDKRDEWRGDSDSAARHRIYAANEILTLLEGRE